MIAGANTGATPPETYEPTDLLPIPGMGVAGSTGTSRVIEFCNKAYALEAVGTGWFHSSALPCEVSVHSDGTNVYIDMLDAEAIFNIFFTDAEGTDAEMEEFAAMASAVKSELRTMIKAGLEDTNESVSGTGTPFSGVAVSYTESTAGDGSGIYTKQNRQRHSIPQSVPCLQIFRNRIGGGWQFCQRYR